jgi:Rrf2 family protein
MKISTKSRYGLTACYIMAKNYNVKSLSLTQISNQSGVSMRYLEQLMLPLRKADIVSASRGAQGGYSLTREPALITLGEIMRALEDGLEIVDCISGQCDKKCNCPTYSIWDKLNKGVNDLLDSITLKDMLIENKEIQNENIS